LSSQFTIVIPSLVACAEPDNRNRRETKRRGELAELRFAVEVMERGLALAKPYGDSEKFDCVVIARPSTQSAPRSRGTQNNSKVQSRRAQTAFMKARKAQASKRALSADLSSGACPERSRRASSALEVSPAKLTRIQVRSAYRIHGNAYDIALHHGAEGRTYQPGDFDLLAAYVAPCQAWYIIPFAEFAGQTSLCLYPHRKNSRGRFEKFRDRWDLLE
jgi:hypothetical protein